MDSQKTNYFKPSAYNLSQLIQNKGTSIRFYSSSTSTTFEPETTDFDNNGVIKFDSLEQGYEEIKFKYLGVSGVYILTSKMDSSRFYIGSSNNLARIIGEYYKLTKGLINPRSSSELEISKTSALNWKLEFIYITAPQTSLILEQYALLKFKPTINNTLKVIPRIDPQWGNFDNALVLINKLLSLFPKGSDGYIRFFVFKWVFNAAKDIKYTSEDLDNKYYCFLVFVYDVSLPNNNPIIYSSINRALKGLQISHSTLLDYINNKYLYKSNIILSFEPLSKDEYLKYQEKPAGDNQIRKHIEVFNQDYELLMEFKSGREMARYFQIDVKVARAAIAKGEYQDFLLISKEVSNRKTIYVFDSDSHELLEKLKGVAKALKHAKVNFYTLKSLIENETSYNGKIYSYKDKL